MERDQGCVSGIRKAVQEQGFSFQSGIGPAALCGSQFSVGLLGAEPPRVSRVESTPGVWFGAGIGFVVVIVVVVDERGNRA